jgi:hypothetical protein
MNSKALVSLPNYGKHVIIERKINTPRTYLKEWRRETCE